MYNDDNDDDNDGEYSTNDEDNDGKYSNNDEDNVNLMLPTFVAPTATIAKYPKAQLPSSTTRSFKAKRPCSAYMCCSRILLLKVQLD